MLILMPLLTACGFRFWEASAPERSFSTEDLLIDRESMPQSWDTSGFIFPAGHDLCTTECVAIRFGTVDDERTAMATHEVFRYQSPGVAQRTFERVYLSPLKRSRTVGEWKYESSLAQQSHFWCMNLTGNVELVCEWAAQYEEYIVVFRTRIVPNKMSLEDMEEVVKVIDSRMSEYLNSPLGNGE